MIIKNCYIENFGTFSRTSFDFTDGLNVIKEDNGWGKSTLAVFIKSMFYGMEYSRKKKLTEYKKYSPWQGGKYGGCLEFSVGDRDYRITRYFGKKEAENVFELYDTKTNMPSSDYSARIGEELFGIDCASFERSIFIKLDSEQNTPEMSDSISAKLNNLVDNTDDINNFETARARLDKLASSVTAKRGTGGMTAEAEEGLRNVEAGLFECDNAEREINALKNELSRASEERERLTARQKELSGELQKFSLAEKRKRYEKLLENEKHFREKSGALSEFFANGAPSAEEIDARMKDAQETDIYTSKLGDITYIDEKRKQLAETEIFFAGSIPAEEEINECQNDIIEYNRIKEFFASLKPTEEERARYDTLLNKYGGVIPSEEAVKRCSEDYDNAAQMSSDINENNVKLSSLYAKSNEKSIQPNILLAVVFAVLTAGCGVGACLVNNLPVRITLIAFAVISALLLCLQFTGKKTDVSEEVNTLERGTEELKNERDARRRRCEEGIMALDKNADLSNISHTLRLIWDDMTDAQTILAKINRYEAERNGGALADCESRLEGFLGKYACESDDYTKRLAEVRGKLNSYTYLLREISAYDSTKKALDGAKERLVPFLERYRAEGATYFEQVQYIRDMALSYRDAEEKLASAAEETAEFVNANDIEALRDAQIPSVSKEEIEAESGEVQQRLDALTDRTARINQNIERQSVIADRRQELESERISLTERKAYLTEKHGILTETIKLLETAKENLTSKYMEDMTPAFNKYLKMIEPSRDNILLMADLSTQILSNGQPWESGYHSRGYSDLVNVCTRLALAEAMYKSEKPFIVLDDPFVNLDDEKTKKALEFLTRLGEEKQILYFTCHESRNIR